MNELSFSTLACPDWPLERILEAAQEYGYEAIELRGLQGTIDLPKAPPFLPAERAATRRRLDDVGIRVACVSSSGVVMQANLDHVRAHAELARDLGCPRVRVFGGGLSPEVPHKDGVERAAETLRSFGDVAIEVGVYVVLETHDSFSTGAQVAELVTAANHPAVFSLWDLHHPYRQGETPETTHQYLRSTVRFIHVKDSVDGRYTLMGEGDIPLVRMIDLLVEGGYEGPISVEWEKRWIPELAEPEIALPQYAAAIRKCLR